MHVQALAECWIGLDRIDHEALPRLGEVVVIQAERQSDATRQFGRDALVLDVSQDSREVSVRHADFAGESADAHAFL